MSETPLTIKRLLTDATGQNIVAALNAIASAVTPPDATQINMGPSDTTKVASTITDTQKGLAYIVDGDTCMTAIPAGAYAYIKNNTHSLAEGLYRNKSENSFPTTGGTANSTVFEAVSEGIANALNSKIEMQQIIPITSSYVKGIAYCTKDSSGNVSVFVDFYTITLLPITASVVKVPSLFAPSADTKAVVVQTISIENRTIEHAYHDEGADIRASGDVRQRITSNLQEGLHVTFMFQYSV